MENNNRSNMTLSDFILRLIHINHKLKKPPDSSSNIKPPDMGERQGDPSHDRLYLKECD